MKWSGFWAHFTFSLIEWRHVKVTSFHFGRWEEVSHWDRSGWRRPSGMPCVVCREVVVGAVCATVHVTDDYLQWASSHCARTPDTTNGDLAQPPDPTLAQPKPAQHVSPSNHTWLSTISKVYYQVYLCSIWLASKLSSLLKAPSSVSSSTVL